MKNLRNKTPVRPAGVAGQLAASGLSASEIGRKVGVSERTARRWLQGKTSPGDAHRAALVAAGIISAPQFAEIEFPEIEKPEIEFDEFDEPLKMANLARRERVRAEAAGSLKLLHRTALTELRAIRDLAAANGELSEAGRLRAHPSFTSMALAALAGLAEHPEALATARGVLERWGYDDRPPPAADDVIEPSPVAASRAVQGLAARAEEWRRRAEADGDPELRSRYVELARRIQAAARRLAGGDPEEAKIVLGETWDAFKREFFAAIEPGALAAALDAVEALVEGEPALLARAAALRDAEDGQAA